MKGFNDFAFNEATMVEVVQFWLDAQFIKDPPKVCSIDCKNNMGEYNKTFTVRVESKEAGKES